MAITVKCLSSNFILSVSVIYKTVIVNVVTKMNKQIRSEWYRGHGQCYVVLCRCRTKSPTNCAKRKFS